MAWWRSPATSATALVIGNPRMDDKGWETHIKSLAGALPIMLGDPRKLSPLDLKQYRTYADWLQLMQTRHDIMSYRQDLPGYGEPKEGSWDGFQRINTDTKAGGILGVFRHGSAETKRTVTIKYLDPAQIYEVRSINGEVVAKATGKELEATGFDLRIDGHYAGELFEIAAQP
jgi:alpha-galactosidase